ncbi:hypothetical protein L804_04052 [Cryptococcus deuterogattii 2001/935-1]|nr:hypothetical protein L804_04052 [Cryptococcus deuterogattii 2001/935-1]
MMGMMGMMNLSPNFGSEYQFQASSTFSPPTSTIPTAREDNETLRYGNLPPMSPPNDTSDNFAAIKA